MSTPFSDFQDFASLRAHFDKIEPADRVRKLNLDSANLSIVAFEENATVAWARLPSKETVEFSFVPIQDNGDCGRSNLGNMQLYMRSRGNAAIPKHALPAKFVSITCNSLEEHYKMNGKEPYGNDVDGYGFVDVNDPETLLSYDVTSDVSDYYPGYNCGVSDKVKALPGLKWLSEQKPGPKSTLNSLEDLFYTSLDYTLQDLKLRSKEHCILVGTPQGGVILGPGLLHNTLPGSTPSKNPLKFQPNITAKVDLPPQFNREPEDTRLSGTMLTPSSITNDETYGSNTLNFKSSSGVTQFTLRLGQDLLLDPLHPSVDTAKPIKPNARVSIDMF
jgi:hypothetical protein